MTPRPAGQASDAPMRRCRCRMRNMSLTTGTFTQILDDTTIFIKPAQVYSTIKYCPWCGGRLPRGK